jgi:hypothetical protein
MSLQDPGIAKGITIVKHFLKMLPAEAGIVRHLPDIGLHIGRAAAQHEVQEILLHASLDMAEGAFVVGVYGIV